MAPTLTSTPRPAGIPQTYPYSISGLLVNHVIATSLASGGIFTPISDGKIDAAIFGMRDWTEVLSSLGKRKFQLFVRTR